MTHHLSFLGYPLDNWRNSQVPLPLIDDTVLITSMVLPSMPSGLRKRLEIISSFMHQEVNYLCVWITAKSTTLVVLCEFQD